MNQKIMEYVKSFGVAIIAALIIRALIIQSYKIPSGSMEDTLLVGDVLFVNKFIFGAHVPFTDFILPELRDPKPGDVVVFKYDGDPNNYIKRLIAVEGQVVQIKDKKVFVDNVEVQLNEHIKFENPQVLPPDYSENGIFPSGYGFNKDNYGPIRIPEGHLFFLGDNRDNSIDSRYRGVIPRRNVVGKALFIYWSWDSFPPVYKIFTKIRWSRIGDIIR